MFLPGSWLAAPHEGDGEVIKCGLRIEMMQLDLLGILEAPRHSSAGRCLAARETPLCCWTTAVDSAHDTE